MHLKLNANEFSLLCHPSKTVVHRCEHRCPYVPEKGKLRFQLPPVNILAVRKATEISPPEREKYLLHLAVSVENRKCTSLFW